MVFVQTDGIVLVLFDYTHTRGPNVAHMQDFFYHSEGHTEVDTPRFSQQNTKHRQTDNSIY